MGENAPIHQKAPIPQAELSRISERLADLCSSPRTEGSVYLARVRADIVRRYTEMGYPIRQDLVEVTQWEPIGKPTLKIVKPGSLNNFVVPCSHIPGSGSTKSMRPNKKIGKESGGERDYISGSQGKRTHIVAADKSRWPAYQIMDNRCPSGCFIVQESEWPIFIPNTDPYRTYFSLGHNDFRFVEDVIKTKGNISLWAKMQSDLKAIAEPNITVGNRAARLWVITHLDSFPGSSGANDNGTGIVATKLLLDAVPPEKYCVIFTAGEELGMLGAKALLESTAPSDFPTTIIDVDSVGLDEVRIGSNFIGDMFDPTTASLIHEQDVFPPYQVGLFGERVPKIILVTSNMIATPDGSERHYLHHHQHTDTADRVNINTVHSASQVLQNMIRVLS